MFLIMSAICVFLTQSNWIMVDSSFGQGFANNSWILSQYCDPLSNLVSMDQNLTCSNNLIKYVRLKKDNQRMDKVIQIKSFQSQVIVDIFFDDRNSASDRKAYFTLNYTVSATEKYKMQFRDYFRNDLTQNSRRICNSTGSGNFDFMTYVGTSPISYQEKFNITIGIESQDDLQLLGVRNVFVYVKFCQQTCKTCSNSISCDTCYSGTLQANGFCLCDPAHQFAEVGVGCRSECKRDYFIARSDNVCVPDRRIKSFFTFFNSTFSSYSPFQFVPDSTNIRISPSLIIAYCSNNYVGSLHYSEGMSFQLADQQNIKFIRLRVTFFIIGFLTNSRIQIILDDQVQGEIIKSLSIFDFNQIRKIYSSSTICSNYEILRIEAILRTYSSTPKLILKGNQLSSITEGWGFRNVTIDTGNCKENCAVCSDFSTCQQCETNYVLFQNGCVSSCPVHSSNCIDYEDMMPCIFINFKEKYEDMMPFSRYLAKGFYNLNMTTDDINKFYSETIPTGNNFLTGQKFSIFPTKFVLGGVMVWNNAVYKKSWVISKPHYAVTIRFNVTYGDLYTGNFYYSIQSVKSIAHPIPASGGQNIIGKSSDERTKYFEIFQNPFLSSQLDIELQCTDTAVNPIDQFCALSDYFIVVHYCLPFCENCNDGTSCNTWESGYINSNCLSNQFLNFDLTTETYNCITCNQVGCLACKNLEECITCDSSSQYNTLINGVCLSINPTEIPNTNPTIQCNIYCETCTETQNSNCLTCVSDFHRQLQNGQCLCQLGFYDDRINLYCLPFCGDFFIVEGEDRDDGYNDPFDGCHNCKLGCGPFCKECIQGFCYECQNGFYMVMNQCVSICEDNILVKYEECEDNHWITYNGCYNCSFSCSNNCIDCQFNKCIQCDEINCWYLQSNSYLPFNGDGINAIQFQQCEDSNLNALDGCFQNNFDCPQFCLTCVTGYCLECDKNSGFGQLDRFNNKCLSFCGDGVKSMEEDCDDGNQIPNDGCFQCQQSCNQNCTDCQRGICNQCEVGYYLNRVKNTCFSICGDGILVNTEECDNGNIQVQQRCEGCSIECQNECLSCFQGQCYLCEQIGWDLDLVSRECKSICGDGIVVGNEQCDDSNEIDQDGCFQCQFQCQSQCTDCRSGICYNCEIQGWHLNNHKCEPVCGDGLIITDLEECDDGNLLEKDGCFQCKLECQEMCTSCRQGICFECDKLGWTIKNNNCEPFCGDGLITAFEQCDDMNNNENDGCHQCQFKCDQYCIDCQSNICQQCIKGRHISKNSCIAFCGDGIVLDNEQCDDQNIIPYDGCYECKYQCDKMCNICEKGVCLECQIGYYLNEYKCITKCGDGIKVGDEQCDDQNEYQRDGCTSCIIDPQYQCEEKINLQSFCYQCQENCEECKYDSIRVKCLRCKKGYFLKDNTCNLCSQKCEECENTPNNCSKCLIDGCIQCDNLSGFYFDQKVRQCITLCGDNIKAGNEQCDDGNRIDQDGCNQKCEIEKDFVCNGSSCYISPQKLINLAYTNSTTTNDFDLIFENLDQDDVCDKLSIQIEQFQSNEFKYEIQNKKNLTKVQRGCEIKFQFFKTLLESNLIHVIISQKKNAFRNLQEETREIIIKPRKLIYYNSDQIAQAQTVVAIYSSFNFFLQLIGPLTIVLGGFNIFWTILDILTWINNFYFINVDYPLNVKLFFNYFQWSDIFNIPDAFELNLPEDPYYFEAPRKFTEKEINPLFLNNIQLFGYLIILAIITYIFSICLISIIQKKYQFNVVKKHQIEIFSVGKIYQKVPEIKSQIQEINRFHQNLKQLPYLINFAYKEMLSFKQNFKDKLLQIINLVFLDICMACILQLQLQSNSDYAIIKINLLLAVSGVLFIIIILKLYSFVCSQHQILYETKIFQNSYSSLYEGINTKNILARNYCYINLIRKAMFIFFTVYFYEIPLLQTSLCCLTCFLNLALILYQNPFENRSILIQSAVPDCCIFTIISLTVLLAVHDICQILTFDQKYLIGWVILFFTGFSIFIQLIFLFQQFCLNLKMRFMQLINLICKKTKQIE